MKLEVPKRLIFRPTLSTIMVQRVLQWERQKKFSRYKFGRDHGREMPFHNINILPNVFRIRFLMHGHFSWSTFGLHLVWDPKTLRMHF
jgi:hypothetical protein